MSLLICGVIVILGFCTSLDRYTTTGIIVISTIKNTSRANCKWTCEYFCKVNSNRFDYRDVHNLSNLIIMLHF